MKCKLNLLCLLGVLIIPGAAQTAVGMQSEGHAPLPNQLIITDSPYSFDKTLEQLRFAIIASNFRLIREQRLDQGIVPVKNSSRREVILYFCNFGLLHTAMLREKHIGAFLPFRVTVIQQGDTVRVMALDPRWLDQILATRQKLGGMADTMHEVYARVLDEATL